jgi:surface carbohydrate biosynthesis protein
MSASYRFTYGGVTRQPIIYLPIEFESREFDSKALLAAVLAGRGYSVVMGQQWMLYENLSRLPAGVVLFKSFNKFHQPAMRVARQVGHRVMVLEEELLAHTDKGYVVAMCADGIFDACDLILADGQFAHDVIKPLSGNKVPVVISGNGRVDLLKPRLRELFQPQIDAIRDRHGDFVLVNTNFSVLKSVHGSVDEVTRIQVGGGFVKQNDPKSLQNWQDYLANENANYTAMLDAINSLAKRRPSQKIIVRPHPGESLARWEGEFKQYPNVSVIREGAHIPWTLACRLLLHTSCTTGFEAHVAGKIALSLVPLPSWITDSMISNHINPVFGKAADLVEATEKILDGGAPPAAQAAKTLERFIWNCNENMGTHRIADLLVEGLPSPRPTPLSPLQDVVRDQKMKDKFSVPLTKCADSVERSAQACKIQKKLAVQSLGDSLFLVTPADVAQKSVVQAAKLDGAQIGTLMESAITARQFQKAYDFFKQNFGEAHRHPKLCFFAAVALFELGKYALAIQYLQSAALANNALNLNITMLLARAHQRLGEFETAYRYAEGAYQQAPSSQEVFELLKETAGKLGKLVPAHWLVIGCSHVRYLRYLQINRALFFGNTLHLECHELAGATAFGLCNPSSQSNALNVTRQLARRMASVDRIVVQFGEIDCRRAAWKAAEVSGRPIEVTIAESVAHLESYIKDEVLPHQKKVLILGAKPQIIGDDDFYKNSLEDERTVFKPLAEREKITVSFNAQLRKVAERLRVDYADIDHVLANSDSRRKFFENAFWDSYTNDTHGNAHYFATLYFHCLETFVGKGSVSSDA